MRACKVGFQDLIQVATSVPLQSTNFSKVTSEDVNRLITSMRPKSPSMDFNPTSVLKCHSDVFASIIGNLANLSFSSGRFPSVFKVVQVSPLPKKQNIDESDPANYRPVSNLNTISKIIERLPLSRLRAHVLDSPNYNVMQSAYRPLHSTETAILHLMNNLFCAAGSKRSSSADH